MTASWAATTATLFCQPLKQTEIRVHGYLLQHSNHQMASFMYRKDSLVTQDASARRKLVRRMYGICWNRMDGLTY